MLTCIFLRYNFSPESMLKDFLDILFMLMRVSEKNQTDFVQSFCLDDDYSEAVMDTILKIIQEKGFGTMGMEADMSHLIKLVS